jgi:hypothetical protein
VKVPFLIILSALLREFGCHCGLRKIGLFAKYSEAKTMYIPEIGGYLVWKFLDHSPPPAATDLFIVLTLGYNRF